MLRIVCAVLMLCLLSGCSSKELTEGKVKKEMGSKLEKVRLWVPVPVGKVSNHCQSQYDGKIEPEDRSPEHSLTLTIAQLGGYVAIAPDGSDYWQASLTDKGRKAPDAEKFARPYGQNKLNGCDFTLYALAVAQPEFGRVVDIQRTQDAWNVSFTYEWVPTEFGRALQKDGEIIAKLSPEQVESLQYSLGANGVRPKYPLPNDEIPMKAQFKIGTDGAWNVGSSPDE